MHIIHGSVAAINITIFVVIAVVIILNFYESRISSNNPTARSNSRAEIAFAINKIVLQTAFAFVPGDWDWPLVILIFVGSLAVWYFYNISDPYYNETVSKMFKIFSSYYLWTCGMLFISKVFESTEFKGGLISWIIGLPFIFIILLS